MVVLDLEHVLKNLKVAKQPRLLWLDLNGGPLVAEATAIPTDPQPLS